jgi:zinc transport system permease protein
MLDDFFARAMIAGIGVALVAGPLGCFVVWRGMAYYGDTMAHSALLGVALGFVLDLDLTLGVFATALAVSGGLLLLTRRDGLPADTVLGILSHSTLALGLVIIAMMTSLRVDLVGYLFGDILGVGRADVAVIWAGGAAVLGALAWVWRPLLATTVNEEMARAEGIAVGAARLVFMLLMAAVVAGAMKIVGVVLITALLVIPAATARRFAAGPEAMAAIAAGLGAAAVAGGLTGSLALDTPSGPSIVVAALALFLASRLVPARSAGAAPPAPGVP